MEQPLIFKFEVIARYMMMVKVVEFLATVQIWTHDGSVLGLERPLPLRPSIRPMALCITRKVQFQFGA